MTLQVKVTLGHDINEHFVVLQDYYVCWGPVFCKKKRGGGGGMSVKSRALQ